MYSDATATLYVLFLHKKETHGSVFVVRKYVSNIKLYQKFYHDQFTMVSPGAARTHWRWMLSYSKSLKTLNNHQYATRIICRYGRNY